MWFASPSPAHLLVGDVFISFLWQRAGADYSNRQRSRSAASNNFELAMPLPSGIRHQFAEALPRSSPAVEVP